LAATAGLTRSFYTGGALARLAVSPPPGLLVAVVVLLAFGRFVPIGFASSDWWPALATNTLSSPNDLVRLFREPLGAADPGYIAAIAGHQYRPLSIASYALDYHVWGLDHPVGWQVTNLLIHLGVTLGLYVLARHLRLPAWAAVLVAVVFTLHPAIVATEPGIARRHDTLSGLFLLPSLVLLLRGRLSLSAVAFGCSVLSKETSLAALPLAPVLLYMAERPLRWCLALLAPTVVALGLRVLALGDLGGYGTVVPPSLEAFGPYRDSFISYLTAFLSPGPPAGTKVEVGNEAILVAGVVMLAALACPKRERVIALLGLAWLVVFGEFYAYLRVYGAWYLYLPMLGPALTVGALAAGAVARHVRGLSLVPFVVAWLATLLVVRASVFLTPYPEWASVARLSADYLSSVDRCAEQGEPPLVPAEKGPMHDFVDATGLADYSVRAYLALRYPSGRAC
jgi:hypothetical protein